MSVGRLRYGLTDAFATGRSDRPDALHAIGAARAADLLDVLRRAEDLRAGVLTGAARLSGCQEGGAPSSRRGNPGALTADRPEGTG